MVAAVAQWKNAHAMPQQKKEPRTATYDHIARHSQVTKQEAPQAAAEHINKRQDELHTREQQEGLWAETKAKADAKAKAKAKAMG